MPTLPVPRLCLAVFAAVLALATPRSHADCIADAAARQQVNADVLRAIGWHESRLQPAALGRNADGSVDLGAFQINSVHLPELARYGIDRAALADGCVCAEVAAWHYRRQIDLLGDNWQAIGSYHSHTPARAAWYANRIAAILMRWKVMPDGPLPFPAERELAPGRPPPEPTSAPPLPAAMVDPSVADADRRTAFGEIAYLPPAR
jgi:hypothetical protein